MTDTIPARLFARANSKPDAAAYYVRKGGQWSPTTYGQYGALVRRAAKSLIALGVEANGCTCILGFNRPEWTILDLATMAAGSAPAGIYTTSSPAEVRYIVHHTESRVILVENRDQWAKVDKVRAELPALKHIVLMDGVSIPEDPTALSWSDFLGKGDSVDDAALDARMQALRDDTLATLIYTSGTTGPPKGVMLSHRNLVWTADCAIGLVGMTEGDASLSYLPLSHIAEQMFTLHVPITGGGVVYFAEAIDKVADNLKEVQPQIFFGVPRIWEKFHSGIATKMKAAPPLRQKIAGWAMGVGKLVSQLRCEGKEPSGLLAFQYGLASKLVFSKLKPAIGLGRARICVSGAAPIAREVLEFFSALDVIVHEVYGQSEGTGPTSFNVPGKTRIGTVGPKLPGIDVKIADDGEILVKGPNVFLGYYKEPVATAETLQNGYLHSGDLGAFDGDGFLRITGRKKDIIITAGGKNITPANIELGIVQAVDLVGAAVVIGDRRKFLAALISLDAERVPAYAQGAGKDASKLHTDKDVRAMVQAGIDAVNAELAQVEQIKKFEILPRSLTIADGELTPTLKVKRNKVAEIWKDRVEAMYAGE